MIVIYGRSLVDPERTAEQHQVEATAAASIGFAERLIDFEALINENNLEKCLRSIPQSLVKLIGVYRGSVMAPEQYEILFNGLATLGIMLINDPEQYRYCHDRPQLFSGDETSTSSVESITDKFQAFVLDGKFITVMKDETQYPIDAQLFEPVLNMVASVPSNFFTVDFARLKNGDWKIVGLKDGQVAGLPDSMNPRAFFDALQHSKQEGVGEFLPRTPSDPITVIIQRALQNSPIIERLKSNSAVVLERIARGAGATYWYYCQNESAVPRLEALLSVGSSVDFYFDGRICMGTYSPDVKQTLLSLYAEEREPLIGALRKDGLEIHMVRFDPTDFADYETEFESSALVFYGAYPSYEGDGAVALTLPDADGVVRSHPY